MASLTYLQYRGGLKVVGLGNGPVVLGRSRSCSIPFPHDDNVSRQHAEIKAMSGGQYVLKDLSSKNGTFVNECPISTWVLKDGDMIRIGTSTLTFRKG